jgi:hypothetical protein
VRDYNFNWSPRCLTKSVLNTPTRNSLPGCTVDDKIDVFEDWMNGWLQRHAHALPDERYVFRLDAAFAALMLSRRHIHLDNRPEAWRQDRVGGK